MKLIKNKKGSPILPILVVLVAFMALTWALVVLVGKDLDRGIGAKQLNMIDTYQEGEEILSYIEQAAKYSSEQAVTDLAHISGTGCCGATSEGHILWNNKVKTCFPSESGITHRLNWKMNYYLEPYLKTIAGESVSDSLNYELKLVQGDVLEISGLPSHTIDLVIEKSDLEYLTLNDVMDETEVRLGNEVEYYSITYNYGDYLFDGPINLPPPNNEICGHIVNYAYQFAAAQCPYSLDYISFETPSSCRAHGLTCATFVSSVIVGSTDRQGFGGNGDMKCKQNAGSVIMLGKDVNVLQAGDVFQAGYSSPGHTGMYVGKGILSGAKNYFSAPRTCYMNYQPDPNGRHVFIHSIGDENRGQPGVCYEYYEDLFSPGRLPVTQFCRLKECT